MESIVRHRYIWFLISLLIIIPGIVSLIMFGLRPSIDFSGGALWEFQFPDRQASELNTDEIAQIFVQQGFDEAKVQLSEVTVQNQKLPAALIRTKPLDANTGEE